MTPIVGAPHGVRRHCRSLTTGIIVQADPGRQPVAYGGGTTARRSNQDGRNANDNAGEFHRVHVGAFDSHGNYFTGEVGTGKRLQKWVPGQ
jgi:hypothetical protein